MNREENRNQIILYEIYSQFEKRIEYCTLRGSAKAPEGAFEQPCGKQRRQMAWVKYGSKRNVWQEENWGVV